MAEKADGEEEVAGVWSNSSAASMKEKKSETCNLLVIGSSSDAISRAHARQMCSSSGDSTEGGARNSASEILSRQADPSRRRSDGRR